MCVFFCGCSSSERGRQGVCHRQRGLISLLQCAHEEALCTLLNALSRSASRATNQVDARRCYSMSRDVQNISSSHAPMLTTRFSLSVYRHETSTTAKTRISADAEGPRDAPQIRNIALEKACNRGMTYSRTLVINLQTRAGSALRDLLDLSTAGPMHAERYHAV